MGPFEIVTELARGGMSIVYRARRADGSFEQDVAVKIFHAPFAERSARMRFAVERRILAALDHPGIARIIDGGETRDGTPYVVMELVRGAPITRFCGEHALELEARLGLFREVCEALQEAHRRGVVHRDIKAGNVLVTDNGQPRLIDFGIARLLSPDGLDVDLPATRAESRMLTPEYASPEQLRGEEAGVTSDVYSLGVLLYELLAGTRPHQVAGMTPGEMERVVCETIPADPSVAVARRRADPPSGLGDSRGLRRRLRGDLDRIVMTAIRREPDQRYPSAKALSEDIERYLTGQPVHARGASRIYRAMKFVGRHRVGVAATAAAFAMLLAALVSVRFQAGEARAQRDMARAEAARAEAAQQFLTEMIRRADPFENAEAPTLAGALRLAIPTISERFAGQPELEADLRYSIGFALQNLGEIGIAREQLERALALRQEHGGAADVAEAHDGLGIVAWWESDFAAGERHFADALVLLENRSGDRADLLRVNVLANWAAMMIDAGDNATSESLAMKALDAAKDAEVDEETLAAIWSSVATARDGLGRGEEALQAFERTLELQRSATGEMHPSFAIVLNNLALMHYGMGRLDRAIEAMRRSVEIRRATLGADHPQTATALFNLARLLTLSGQLAEAEIHAREALDVATGGYPPGHPRIGKAHEALAIVLRDKGEIDAALDQAMLALAIYETAAGVDPAWLDAVRTLIAGIRDERTSR